MKQLLEEGQELVKNLFLVVKEEEDYADLTRLHAIFEELKQLTNGNSDQQTGKD